MRCTEQEQDKQSAQEVNLLIRGGFLCKFITAVQTVCINRESDQKTNAAAA
jgi:hypothetical protein